MHQVQEAICFAKNRSGIFEGIHVVEKLPQTGTVISSVVIEFAEVSRLPVIDPHSNCQR